MIEHYGERTINNCVAGGGNLFWTHWRFMGLAACPQAQQLCKHLPWRGGILKFVRDTIQKLPTRFRGLAGLVMGFSCQSV